MRLERKEGRVRKMSYEKLFEKGKIGKITIKNRCAMMPMGTVRRQGRHSNRQTYFVLRGKSKGRNRTYHKRIYRR